MSTKSREMCTFACCLRRWHTQIRTTRKEVCTPFVTALLWQYVLQAQSCHTDELQIESPLGNTSKALEFFVLVSKRDRRFIVIVGCGIPFSVSPPSLKSVWFHSVELCCSFFSCHLEVGGQCKESEKNYSQCWTMLIHSRSTAILALINVKSDRTTQIGLRTNPLTHVLTDLYKREDVLCFMHQHRNLTV